MSVQSTGRISRQAAAFELQIDREAFAEYILETLGKGA